MFTCRVLGPTEVEVGGAPVDVGGPLPRRLLAALVAAEGRPVSDERLAEAVWGDQQPPQPTTSLQAYVSRLRRALGRDVLRRAAGGYVLVPGPGGTDVQRFTELVARARELAADGQDREALRVYGDALALWRGDAYADLLPDAAVAAARHRLEELREAAVEERLAARLATGDAPGAVAELEPAVRSQPYREGRWALLIVALYRSGRQREALAVLRRVRALLAEELGIDPGPELQALERRVLAQDPHLLLPAAPSGAAARTQAGPRLSRPLSTFVGRGDELAAVTGLLAARRLVTVVGPAGAGKTRLAVEYAAGRTEAQGCWLVRLADVGKPDVLAAAVAGAVGVAEVAVDSGQALAAALGDRAGLLILDNCEHLVADVADLVLAVLDRCPRLRLLATSREPLGVDGEHVVPVEPLPADTATELLVDRIQAIRPGWRPTAEETAQARHLAAALDGIPLALELAAARARVLSLQELVDHLDDRFAVLGRVARGSLTPHATLDAAIGWSIDLLSPADRALLWRLWPFEGGFTLDAVEAVRAAGSGGGALAALSSLVTRSVVVADTTVTPSRYRLLETVRAYCRRYDPDPAGSRQAHAAWVRALVERSAVELRGERSAHAVRVLSRELPNLRAGIDHDLRVAPEAAVRTVGLLDWFWYRGGHLHEGRRLVRAALAAAPGASAVDRARAWGACGTLSFSGGDLDGAMACLQRIDEALATAPENAEQRTVLAQTRFYQALFWLAREDFAATRRSALEASELAERAGHEWLVCCAQMSLGAALMGLGDAAQGRSVLLDAARRGLACGQRWAAAMSDLLLARFLLAGAGGGASDDGRPDPGTVAEALVALGRSLDRFVQEDDLNNALSVLHTGALALTFADRPAVGAQLLHAVRRHAVRHGVRPESTDPLGAAGLERWLAGALDPSSRAAAEQAADGLDWAGMVALLDPAGGTAATRGR